MRCIGNLSNEARARLFADCLFELGIRNDVESGAAGGWDLWVHEDDQIPAAQALFQQFQQNPEAPEFRRAAGTAERVLTAEQAEDAAYRRKFFRRHQVFRGSRRFGVGIFTYALIGACVLVAIFSKLGHDDALLRHLFISWQENPQSGWLPEVRAGEFWRLVTPALIHFGPVHLLFNMMWLFQLGSMIEGLQGRGRFVGLFLLLAVSSCLAQYFMKGPGFGGMSGVNYGLFGYVWIRGRVDPASGLFIDRQNTILMLVWLVVCMTGWVGPVANWAHGAGLAVGAACGWIAGLRSRR